MSEEIQPTQLSQELIAQALQLAIVSIAKLQPLPPEVDQLPQQYMKMLGELIQHLKQQGLAGPNATVPQRMKAIRQQMQRWGLVQPSTQPTADQIINQYPAQVKQSVLANEVTQSASCHDITMDKKSRPEIKYNIFIIVFIIIFFVYASRDCSNRAKEREVQKERYEQWKQSPAGMNSQARLESMSKDAPIKSLTGDLFYKGMLCGSDCSGHIAGYEYAMEYGMTYDAKCYETYSSSFLEGCKQAVEDIIAEMQPSEDEPRDYDYDSDAHYR
ncbi:MAG: hypothetical protein ACK5M5_11555 [Limnobaculum xujianqingii]